LLGRRKALGGFLPKRVVSSKPLPALPEETVAELLRGSGRFEVSTTMGFVRLLSLLIRDKNIGRHIVPIIPDEARTFGLDALFREIGIYSLKGQLYDPVDRKSLLYYHEAKDGQILEEGITEAGSMASFIAAGTCYANNLHHMVPFYIYYSMFGPQRIGDLMWLAGDIKARGFLLGATAGRTTLNGEGLQHQDGHSLILTSSIPTLVTYDPAFVYELAVIVADGLRRMYTDGEDIFYYLSLYNENYLMPQMPDGVKDGILKGLYRFKASPLAEGAKAHIFGSGPIIREALRAQEILAEKYKVSADVWSATSYKLLRNDALRFIQPRRTRVLPTNPAHLAELRFKIGGEQVVQGIDPFVQEDDVNVRQREHLHRRVVCEPTKQVVYSGQVCLSEAHRAVAPIMLVVPELGFCP
jgi:pyruvate dehydrogenase E1 component